VDSPRGEVRVKLLTGPYAGRVASGTVLASGGRDALGVVSEFLRHGWRWQVLWPRETGPSGPEASAWRHADLAGRILLALRAGRAVRFMGRRWQARPGDLPALRVAAGEIEDAIAAAGRGARILLPDGDGDLVICLQRPARQDPGKAR
jgi:hypothetical protein